VTGTDARSLIGADARRALEDCLGPRIEFDAPLSRHTSLRIGGPADAIATPGDRDELARVLAVCHEAGLPTTVLGAGFNVLVLEGGIRGVVLRLKKLRRIERGPDDRITVEAGASHATMTRYCVDQGLSGLEFGAGIPGTLGGWLAMNAGIGTRETKDVVVAIEWMSADGQQLERTERADLDFRYRGLHGLAEGAVLVAAELQLEASEPAKVRDEVDRLLAQRQATQPIDVPSCGSVFRNPKGDFAGRLIEEAGLKGLRVGAAEISPVHANFIVNLGGATAADVLELIERARGEVEQRAGIRLETEVRILGVPAPAPGGGAA
jgi:UDP-N-acetylmuramate dehydrogenase